MACLTRFGASGAKARLVCIPHAGASGDVYAPWARELEGVLEVWGVTPAGRRHRSREALNSNPTLLIDEIVAGIAEFDDLPLIIFGHSMGALIGYEVAVKLESKGEGPRLVIVSGSSAPHLRSKRADHQASDEELAAALVDWGGTSAELLGDPHVKQFTLPPLRADLRLCDNYERSEPAQLRAALATLAGRQDQVAPLADVRAWRLYSSNYLGVTTIDGGHFFVSTRRSQVIDHVASLAYQMLSR